MLKKIAILFLSLLTVVLILTATGCGSESTSSVSQNSGKVLVPQKASMIAKISIDSVLADNTIRNAYDEASKNADAPATFDELIQTSQDQTGLDFTTFKEATIFGDVNDISNVTPENGLAASQGYFGIIVSGTFKNDELIASIESETGQKPGSESYNGYEIYTITDTASTDTSNSTPSSLAFLDEGVLVIGSSEAVKDVIDIKNGKKGLDDDLLTAYENVDGSLGKLALNIPKEWLSQIPDEQDMGALGILELKPFREMKTGSVTFNKTGDTTDLEIKVDFSSGSAAISAQNTLSKLIEDLQNLVNLPGGSGDMPQMSALINLLNSAQLSVSDKWLTLRLELTTEQIKELTPLLQGMFLNNSQ